MRLFRSTFIVASLWVTAAGAQQDMAGLKAAVGALSSPPTASQLTELASREPNAYIYYVQTFLKEKGTFSGSLNGQLTGATIRSLLAFCREAGIVEVCSKGPLETEAVAATSAAIVAAVTPAVAEAPVPAEKPAVAAEAPAVEPLAPVESASVTTPAEPAEPATASTPATLPTGWGLGSTKELGISAEVLAAGPADATIRFTGTASKKGYFNVYIGKQEAAAGKQWETSVSAAQEPTGGQALRVLLRTRVGSEAGYAGELFRGVEVPVGNAPQPISATGQAPTDAVNLRPYIQLWVEQGEAVDLTLRLANSSFVTTN